MTKEVHIRAAMERLLADRAIHTDGRLDVTTLAAEAGVARQDLYRTYRHLLDEFRTHVKRLEQSPATPDRQAHEIQRLKEKLEQTAGRAARYRAERNDARRQRDANASQVAYLHEQNRLVRQQLDITSRITPLHPQRSPVAPGADSSHAVAETDPAYHYQERRQLEMSDQRVACLSAAANPTVESALTIHVVGQPLPIEGSLLRRIQTEVIPT